MKGSFFEATKFFLSLTCFHPEIERIYSQRVGNGGEKSEQARERERERERVCVCVPK